MWRKFYEIVVKRPVTSFVVMMMIVAVPFEALSAIIAANAGTSLYSSVEIYHLIRMWIGLIGLLLLLGFLVLSAKHKKGKMEKKKIVLLAFLLFSLTMYIVILVKSTIAFSTSSFV